MSWPPYTVDNLKDWDRCRKKFELHVVRHLQWPTNPKNFRFGLQVHQLLDATAHGLPLTPWSETLDPAVLQAYRLLSESDLGQLPVIASEWPFYFTLNGMGFTGRVDRITQDQDIVALIDWKTGTTIPPNPEDHWQTQLYLYAVYEAQADLGLTLAPEQLRFDYLQVIQNELRHVRVAYNKTMHQETFNRLVQTVSAIQAATRYPLPDECPDRFCPYRAVCGIEEMITA